MENTKIKALLIDLGNVLVINHPEWAARKFSRINKLSLAKDLAIMGDDNDFMKGFISSAEFAEKYRYSMDLNITEAEFHAIYVDIFTLNEPLVGFLEQLKEKMIMVMVSNTEITTVDFLKNKFPRIFSLFNGRLALSYLGEVRSIKPERGIYDYALKLAGVLPQDVLMIDDKPGYVDVARKLGMRAIQYTTLEQLKRDFESLNIF